MTVNELIEQLKNYPGDMKVLVLGYEGGYNDAGVTTEDIIFNANETGPWYYGSHESAELLGASNGIKSVIVAYTGKKKKKIK
jgi:hypothetical protein